eukprot:6214800-Pleurochrysis_carterae.AAC.1
MVLCVASLCVRACVRAGAIRSTAVTTQPHVTRALAKRFALFLGRRLVMLLTNAVLSLHIVPERWVHFHLVRLQSV